MKRTRVGLLKDNRALIQEIADLKERLERAETVIPERDAWMREYEVLKRKLEIAVGALMDGCVCIPNNQYPENRACNAHSALRRIEGGVWE